MATRTTTNRTTKTTKTTRSRTNTGTKRASSKPTNKSKSSSSAVEQTSKQAPKQAPKPIYSVGDVVKYTPPWLNSSSEVEYGVVVEITDKMVYVKYPSSSVSLATHPANLSRSTRVMIDVVAD